MQAVVTAIGAYNGVPAFEYEIRDDFGRVQAFDFVIIRAKPGETWDDLAALAQDYLAGRAAKWALSDTVEKRLRRKELVSGGVRLARADKGSRVAPALMSQQPASKHLAAVSVSALEAGNWVRAEAV